MNSALRSRAKLSRWFLQQDFTPVSLLRALWLLLVLWFEYGHFYYSLWSCTWPDKLIARKSKHTHVLLLADPQIRYSPPQRRRWIDRLQRFFYHLDLKKNWSFAKSLRPHAVVFLGDMLASGSRVESDNDFAQYYHKFRDLFAIDKSTPLYYAPGNEDVGLCTDPRAVRSARSHYTQHFGPANRRISISNHTFILLDAPGLVEEDYQRAETGQEFDVWTPKPGGSVEFIKSVIHEEHPTILFTHIPLSRPDTVFCGPLREKGTIRRGVGSGYQNIFGKKTTEFLFETIQPSIVFSGDDRDYCEYNHQVSLNRSEGMSKTSIREVTVKSFSPVKHIRNPGFHLLSLIDPSATPSSKTFADRPCLLPSHHNIYNSRYLPLLVLTSLILVVRRYKNTTPHKRQSSLPSYMGEQLDPYQDTSQDTSPGSEQWQHIDGDTIDGFGSVAPYNPLLPRKFDFGHISPRDSLPPTLRTPVPSQYFEKSLALGSGNINAVASTPTFRASTQSSTPLQPSFLPSPTELQSSDHLGGSHPDEHISGIPYTNGHVYRTAYEHGYDNDHSFDLQHLSPSAMYFPPNRHQSQAWWIWTYTFVFRGRRRRMTVSIPTLWRLRLWGRRNAETQLKPDTKMRRRCAAVVQDALLDLWEVSWPAIAFWTLCTWWTML